MRLHGNARTCLHSRLLIVRRIEAGWTVAAAAEAAGVSERTAAKWLARYRGEGRAGLVDRSSAPRRVPRRTAAERERAIESLRRLRMTAAEIAEILRMPLSTVSAVLQRIGLGKAPGSSRSSRPPVRMRTARRARPHRRQEARSIHSARASPPRPRPWTLRGGSRLRVRPRLRRRLQPSRLRRSAHRRAAATATGFLRRALEWFTAKACVSSE